ncbi:TonB C-terminal domain-containing protein [Undibacterium sp.]|uniref:TonB C-terminal domain-containing protein n=1 Tax=Undibacterium sp. TaxID=1914977 RepID=UPI0025D28D90|nr:TonB C-terminal domain-containing protein [Undibacterium sp.]
MPAQTSPLSDQQRLSLGLLISLSLHALLLNLAFNAQGLGHAGLASIWPERHHEIPALHIALTAPAAALAAPVAPLLSAEQAPPMALPPQGITLTQFAPTPAPAALPPATIAVQSTPKKMRKAKKLSASASAAVLAPVAVEQPAQKKSSLPATSADLIALAKADQPSWRVPATPELARAASATATPPIAEPSVQTESTQDPQNDAEKLADESQEMAKQADAQQEAARLEALRIETERQQLAQQSAAKLAAAKQEANRQETARVEAARLADKLAIRLADKLAAEQAAERQEAAKKVAAQQLAKLQEAAQLEAARSEAARLATASLEAARIETERQQLAQQSAAKLAAAQQEANRQEAARADAVKLATKLAAEQAAAQQLAQLQEAKVQDAARHVAALAEGARQVAAQQESSRRLALELEAKRLAALQAEAEQRQEKLRAIGRQLNLEAAQRDAAALRKLPATSGARRGRILARTDPNPELAAYAQTWGNKIERSMSLDMVREALKQPHLDPMVTVAVRSDGSVESVTFAVSSGVPAIDEAIRRIVYSQVNYPAFPAALLKDYDVIEIRRTWYFDSSIRLY